MPRLTPVPRAEAPPEAIPLYDLLFGDRDPVAEPGTATGTPGDWWTVVARSPDVFRHCVAGFALYRSRQRVLPPRLRELDQTRAGFARGSRFVYSQHCKSMRGLGFSEAQIEGIKAWATADCFDAAERAVLAYTDELVLQGGRVRDATFAALRAHLCEEAVLELTYITLTYALHATLCRALRLEYDDLPEPVDEVPAPSEAAARDVLAGVGDDADG